MQAYRIETTITETGQLTLSNLPFQKGETIEVIILPHPAQLPRQNSYPLRGTPIVYIDPTEPVAESDWEALQ